MDLINTSFNIFNVYIVVSFFIIITMITIEIEVETVKEGKNKGKQIAINTSLILAAIILVGVSLYIALNYMEYSSFIVLFTSLSLICANKCTPIQSLSNVFNKSANKLTRDEVYTLITSLSAIDLFLTYIKIDGVVRMLLSIRNRFISEFLIVIFLFVLFYVITFYSLFSLSIIIGRISRKLGFRNKNTVIQSIIDKINKDLEIKINKEDFILIKILKFIGNVLLGIINLLKTFLTTLLETMNLFVLKPILSIIGKIVLSSERESIKFLIKSSIVISLTILKIFTIYSTDLKFTDNILNLYDFLATVIIIPIVFEWISLKQ